MLNVVLFFGIFMVALPALAHFVLPLEVPLPRGPRVWVAAVLALSGVTAWIRCLETDVEWIRAAIRIFGLAIPGHVRIFHNRELAKAMQWVAE